MPDHLPDFLTAPARFDDAMEALGNVFCEDAVADIAGYWLALLEMWHYDYLSVQQRKPPQAERRDWNNGFAKATGEVAEHWQHGYAGDKRDIYNALVRARLPDVGGRSQEAEAYARTVLHGLTDLASATRETHSAAAARTKRQRPAEPMTWLLSAMITWCWSRPLEQRKDDTSDRAEFPHLTALEQECIAQAMVHALDAGGVQHGTEQGRHRRLLERALKPLSRRN